MARKHRPHQFTNTQGFQVPSDRADLAFRASKEGGSVLVYLGYANVGTDETLSRWQIRKYEYSGSDVISVKFAYGLSDYSNVWDDGTQATITGATQANPCVITAVAHGFSSNDKIEITDVAGMTELNTNFYLITVLTDDTFSLQDLDGVDVDSTGFGAYTMNGTAHKRTYANYTYS